MIDHNMKLVKTNPSRQLNLSKTGLILAINLALAVSASAYPGTTTSVTGGDAGNGLTFDAPNVVGALNIGAGGGPLTIQGVQFASDTQNPYSSLSWSGFGGGFQSEFTGTFSFSGSSANDVALGTLYTSFFYGANYMGITVTGLTPGATYKFNALSSLAGFSGPRGLEIFAQNTGQASGTIQDHILAASTTAYDTTFLWNAGSDGKVSIGAVPGTFDGNFPGDPGPGSWLNGLVITQITPAPEPSTFALAGIGLVVLFGFRRRH